MYVKTYYKFSYPNMIAVTRCIEEHKEFQNMQLKAQQKNSDDDEQA